MNGARFTPRFLAATFDFATCEKIEFCIVWANVCDSAILSFSVIELIRSFSSPTLFSEPAFSRAATSSALAELVKFRKKVSVPATTGDGEEFARIERNRSA